MYRHLHPMPFLLIAHTMSDPPIQDLELRPSGKNMDYGLWIICQINYETSGTVG